MFPSHIRQRSHLVQVTFLQLTRAGYKLSLRHKIKRNFVQRKSIMRQLQIFHRRKRLTKMQLYKFLKLTQFSILLISVQRIVLPHHIVVIFRISQFISNRRQIPLSRWFYVVMETLVRWVIGKRNVVYVGQALDYLPLSLGGVVELELACVVEECWVGVELDLLVELEEGFVHQA